MNPALHLGSCCHCLRDFKIISFMLALFFGSGTAVVRIMQQFMVVSEILLAYAESSEVICFLLSLESNDCLFWTFFFYSFFLKFQAQLLVFSPFATFLIIWTSALFFLLLQFCLEWLTATIFQRLFNHFWTHNGTPKIRLFSLVNWCKVHFTESILGFDPPLKDNPNN